MTVEHDRFIRLNGLQFHYREWGQDDAPTLVLLHGGNANAYGWDTVARAFQEHYRILALDQRGHGETDWAPDYAWRRWVEDLEAFIDSLGLSSVTLMGASLGGSAAYRCAALHPGAVTRLVVVDIAPEIAPTWAARLAARRQREPGHREPDLFGVPEEAVQSLRAGILDFDRADEAELRHSVGHNLVPTGDGRWRWRYDPALLSPQIPRSTPPLTPAEDWELVARITCPTLLMRGADSPLLTRETADRMVREIARCELVEVPDSGHRVPLDNPTGFLAAVWPFLCDAPR